MKIAYAIAALAGCLLVQTSQATIVNAASPYNAGYISAGTYSVTASGLWSIDGDHWTTATGKDALGANWDEFFAGAQKSGLVAYIGSSLPFSLAPVGTPGYYAILDGTQTITFNESGTLWLTINDDASSGAWGDNSGRLSVDIVSTAVPEPSTIVAGAMLLLPIGVSTFRSLRRNKK